ncbi:MAG: hypothetical protein HY036_01660 [Nitrospirae bacterium]|nr:hypothetical protein [Nitrospirota bacterium]
MKLIGTDGQMFELRIVGYQYPDLETEEFDSNWLQIEGKVTHPKDSWTFTDPCLLTYEVAELAKWLESLAENRALSRTLRFIEPNLSFEFRENPFPRTLRIYLDLEARPRWARGEKANAEDIWVEFPVSDDVLRQAADSLRRQLEKYPKRAEV